MKTMKSRHALRRVLTTLVSCGLIAGTLPMAGNAAAANAIQTLATNYQPTINETIDASGFKHPGVGLTRGILENMRAQVRAQKEPWNTYFNQMVLSGAASKTVTSNNQASDPTKPSILGLASQGDNSRFIADGLKAYTQAILYYITGDATYRANAMRIIRIWSQMDPAQYIYFTDSHIHTGIPLNRMVAAAEILRYTSSPSSPLEWTEQDTAMFSENLVTPVIETFLHKNSYFMNQHNYPLIGATAGYIFKGDRERYDEAVEWATVNKTALDQGQNGAIKQLFRLVTRNDLTGEAVDPPVVQHVEMGRDQAHGAGDLTNNEILARMWLAQGTRLDPVEGTVSAAPNAVGPYDFLNDRVLHATELFARFMMGYETPWVPTAAHTDADGNPTIVYKQISGAYRGRLTQNMWETFYYYKYVKGINIEERAPYYTKMFAARVSYNWDGVDGGGDFWLFIPPAAEAEGVQYLVKPIVDPYRELEDRYSAFDPNSVAMREGSTAFVRITASGAGSKLALVGSANGTKNLGFRVRTNGVAVMEVFGDTITLPDTKGQWRYVTYALNAYQGLGDLVNITIKGSGTTVDIDHVNVQAGTLLTPPVFAAGKANLNIFTEAGSTATINADFSASDPSASDVVSYQIDNMPAGALFNASTGAFSWKPAVAGTYSFVVTASDGTAVTTRQVQVVVSTDRQSSINAAIAAYNAGTAYVGSSLADYTTAYAGATNLMASASDAVFFQQMALLSKAVAGLQELSPLNSDGSLNYLNMFTATTFGTELPNALDGSPDSFVGYYLAQNLTHTFDLGPSFTVSAQAFQVQVRASFPDRIGGIAMFGSNDNENWTRLTPGLTSVTEDMQTMAVQDELKDQQFRFLKMEMVEPSGIFLELSEFRIFGTRQETVNRLSAVSIGSSQALKNRIIPGNTVKLTFRSTEAISNVSVVSQGQAVTLASADKLNWTATWVASGTVVGPVRFKLNYKTAAGIDATTTLVTTDGTSLFVSDQTGYIGNLLDITSLQDSTSDRTPAQTLQEVNYLFDSNVTTQPHFFLNGSGAGGSITFDFKGGGQATLARVEVLARQDNGLQARLNGAVVMGSNDNVTWETISNAARTSLDWQTLAINSAQPYRYIRFYNPNTWYGNMAELRLFGVTASVNKVAAASLSSAQSLQKRIVAGNTVKLTFKMKEAVNNVVATIQGQAASVSTADNINFTATATMPQGAAAGAVTFAINYKLSNGADGFPETQTTDGSALTLADETGLIRNVTSLTRLIDSTSNRTAAQTLQEVNYLFDSNATTQPHFFVNGSGTGAYITFDFKDGGQVRLARVDMLARQDNGLQARINGAVVMGSNDNVTWTTISNPARATLEWQTLAIGGAQPYRYIRFYNPNAWFGNMAELRLFGVAESTNKIAATSLSSVQSLQKRIVPGNTVKLTFTAREAVNNVVATIQGQAASVSTTDNVNYTATATLPQGVAAGPVKFAINYKLSNGADGSPQTETTDSSALTLVDESDLIRNMAGITTLIDSTANRTAAATLQEVNYLFDSNLTTQPHFFLNGSGAGAFITFDFQAGKQATLAKVEMVARQDSNYQRINGTVVMGSNDNATWTTISNAAQSTMEWQALTVNSALPYRYIRLYNPNTWFGNMTELRFHGTVRAEPADISASVKMTQQGALYNRMTGKYAGGLTITNTSGAALAGPLQVKLNSLTSGLILDNASGTSAGAPYVSVSGTLNAGATLTVPLTFSGPAKSVVGYTPVLYKGAF